MLISRFNNNSKLDSGPNDLDNPDETVKNRRTKEQESSFLISNNPNLSGSISAEEYGCKAANLQELASLFQSPENEIIGMTVIVPEFFPLGDAVIKAHADKYVPQWRELFSEFQKEQAKNTAQNIPPECEKILEELRYIIADAFAEHPIEDEKALIFIENIKEKQSLMMVRSTGAEDSADAANPGGNLSVIGVEPNIQSVSKAIGQVFASYFSEKSLKQRLLSNESNIAQDVLAPVLLQCMIGEPVNGAEEAKEIVRSGVIYTRKMSTMIQVLPGPGKTVVESIRPVDTFTITHERNVYSQIALKNERLVPTKEGLAWKKNPPELREEPSLSSHEILGIDAVGEKIRRHYGEDMDVEYIYHPAENTLYLVQARPIPRGKSNSITPSSVSPSKMFELKQSLLSGEIVKHVAEVVTKRTHTAQVIISREEILVANNIEQALSKYLKQTNSPVRAVFIKQPAASTSHAAAQFNLVGIPVLQIEDDKEWMQWSQKKDPPALLVDPQRGQILVWREQTNSQHNAKYLLEEGFFQYPIMPITPSPVFTKEKHDLWAQDSQNTRTKFGDLIRQDPDAALHLLYSKLNSTSQSEKIRMQGY